jgi:hypothetical protein
MALTVRFFGKALMGGRLKNKKNFKDIYDFTATYFDHKRVLNHVDGSHLFHKTKPESHWRSPNWWSSWEFSAVNFIYSRPCLRFLAGLSSIEAKYVAVVLYQCYHLIFISVKGLRFQITKNLRNI